MIRYRIDKSKVHVVHNGIDTHASEYSDENAGYALYVGRISQEKGIETLLRAGKALKHDLTLKIVGSGPLLDKLKTEYPDAQFVGYKTGAALAAIVKRAAFIVVPSEWYENCSMSVLEAMAFGKPVIGSNIGGIPEQIEDNDTGILFERGNVDDLTEKLTLLFTNPALRKAMGKRARIKLEREYSLDAHCRRLIEVYKEVVAT
jgi:glycosyltransferase involved in cell wall biosynthesis